MRNCRLPIVLAFSILAPRSVASAQESTTLKNPPKLSVVTPPLDSEEHLSTPGDTPPLLPVTDTPFFEHVRRELAQQELRTLPRDASAERIAGVDVRVSTPKVTQGKLQWVGTVDGLYSKGGSTKSRFERHATYGVEGPPSNVITGMAVDSRNRLWVVTPAGLGCCTADGGWQIIRGRDGLPVEDLTCISIDSQDRIWLGSTQGLIQYRPYAEERQWYYRAGRRYLPNDRVTNVQVSEDGRCVYARTSAGWTCIEEVARTLFSKAEYLEARYQDRHRRLGMPAPAIFEGVEKTDHWTHEPQPSDGLWTSYHVAAMSMAYALTGEARYRDSASEGMKALYFLQNVTGIEGLVARSVADINEPAAATLREQSNWRSATDGKTIWRDDVSSDQITGHYFAFYTYYEHIARHDPQESALLKKQLRQVTDYILEHNYQIIDWDGKMTLWGWWNPELLNDEPQNFLESGIYSLMMLSFLKTAHYITGDEKYLEHYRSLIEEHGYLSNLLLQKKVFPDELNHSDDQLSALVFYSFLQLELDPFIRDAVHRSLRRHARIERDERNSLFDFVYATVDSEDADILGGIQTLREMPQDRRNWGTDNSVRADVRIDTKATDHGKLILLDVLPADERDFERWNDDPYRAKTPGNGLYEGTGVHYLLPYWIGRYHGLIAPPER